ncbi:MAG TPA: ABC transporter, partial [Roseiarcus sp.]|nr:ABC transporter [Roseiarcus sp.]
MAASAFVTIAALAAAAAAFAPFSDYVLHILVETATYAIAVFGLTIVLGHCGQINLAQAAFFGFGAYAVGLGVGDFHLGFWLALVSGAMATLVMGAILG